MSWHPQSKFLDVDGRRVHVVDVGEGPVVLLLHGFLHSSYTWRANIEPLARRHRVLVPDLLGHGWSERGACDYSLQGFAGQIEALLAALGVEKLAAAVGNSLGGGVALSLALRRPDLIERLVLVSSIGLRMWIPPWLGHLRSRVFGPLFRATACNQRFVRHALGLLAYRRIPVDDHVLYGFQLGRPGSQASAAETTACLWKGTGALSRRLGEVQAPALILWGSQDRIVSSRVGKALATRLQAGQLEVFEDCGHCAQEEDPARFNARLERFLMPTRERDLAASG